MARSRISPPGGAVPDAPGVEGGEATGRAGPLRAPGAVLLVSTYELGHQPLSLASPLALLRRAGYDPVAVDTAVEPLDDAALRIARLVALSTPMHTATRLAQDIARRVRALRPDAHISLYGLYAALNADDLLGSGLADTVIGGESEEALVGVVRALDAGTPVEAVPGVSTRAVRSAPVLRRLAFAPPERSSLPPLQSYARLERPDGSRALAGYTEASRGCLHTCLHCPITPVYGGRFFVVPADVVTGDIRAQVAAGAEHITFGDPDFLNGPGHALRIVRALHAEFPRVTWDATIKVEHILERRAMLPELRALGCAFIVSAFESLSDTVLRTLAKGHTRADIEEALRITAQAGLPVRPTLLPFTPWSTLDDYLDLLRFIADRGLERHIDPVQLAIRLLVPPGSALAGALGRSGALGALEPGSLAYAWRHPDPRMDRLQREVERIVARSAGEPPVRTLDSIERCAREIAGTGTSRTTLSRRGSFPPLPPAPRLTEPWFC